MRLSVSRLAFAASLLVTVAMGAHFYPLLPDVMASHFNGSGVADGWMGKDAFFALFGLVGIGSVALLPLITRVLGRLPVSLINLPNKDYWLAPSRRQATLAGLQVTMLDFSTVTMALMGLVLYSCCVANLQPQPVLGSHFAYAMVAYLAYTVVWTGGLIWRYRLPAVA